MDIQEIINGRIGVGLGYALGRITPPEQGERLAGWVGRVLGGKQDLPMVRAVRANQWIASGKQLSGEALDQAVVDVFRHTALTIYEYYHTLSDHQKLKELVAFPPKLGDIFQEAQKTKRGVIIAGVHVGNFDLVLRATAEHAVQFEGMRVLALSAQSPGKGYQWQNDLRRQIGIEIVPASLSAMKLAIQHLEEGGVVVTGLDRPIPGAKYTPRFFNLPAPVPVLHVTLAQRTNSPVIITGAMKKSDGAFEVFVSDPFYTKTYPDRRQEIISNAESILEIAADFIRMAPQQWSMFYPVWPEVIDEQPA